MSAEEKQPVSKVLCKLYDNGVWKVKFVGEIVPQGSFNNLLRTLKDDHSLELRMYLLGNKEKN